MRDRHGTVSRAAAGGEGVGRLLGADIDARLREAGVLSEAADDTDEIGRGAFIHFAAAHGGDGDFVAVEERDDVAEAAEDERDDDAMASAERVTDPEDQAEQRGEQGGGLDVVHKAGHEDSTPVLGGPREARRARPGGRTGGGADG